MEAMLFFLLQIEILVWHITTTALPPGIVALLPFIIFFFWKAVLFWLPWWCFLTTQLNLYLKWFAFLFFSWSLFRRIFKKSLCGWLQQAPCIKCQLGGGGGGSLAEMLNGAKKTMFLFYIFFKFIIRTFIIVLSSCVNNTSEIISWTSAATLRTLLIH